MGFLELKKSGLPCIPWKLFDESTRFDNNYLWTIRTAVNKGDDQNLPRVVGKNSEQAYSEAMDIYKKYKDIGIVIYYPYFIADKSGTLEISAKNIVIEAVNEDLWNLVTYNKRDITVVIENGSISRVGKKDFLKDSEVEELFNYANKVKYMFRDYIAEGKSILSEWSYAYNTDNSNKIIGERYLVFYEIRAI